MRTIILSLGLWVISPCVNAQMTFAVNNRFASDKFDKLYIVDSNGIHSKNVIVIKTGMNRKSEPTVTTLKGYVKSISDNRDSMNIEFWSFKKDYYPNTEPYVDSNNQKKTFAYKINWHNGHFKVPFRARALTAVSIPFRVKMRNKADLEAEFLNVGITHVWLWGHTKYYKSKYIESRQFYYGVGPFLAFSQLKIDSTNTRGYMTSEKQVANFSYGVNGLISVNNFHFVLAFGVDNTFGSSARHYQDNISNRGASPWIGFGVGFKLVDLTVKSENK